MNASRTRLAAAVGLLALWGFLLMLAGAGAPALVLPILAVAFVIGGAARDRWPPLLFHRVFARVRARATAGTNGVRSLVVGAVRSVRAVVAGLADRRRRWKERRFSRSSARAAFELNRAANEHRRHGRLEAAIVCGEHALAILTSLGDRRGEALTLNGLGLALDRAGHVERAEACFERAAAILGELDERELEGQVLANLGNFHERRERLERAQECWRDALTRLDGSSPAYERLSERVAASG
jgi:tetratricopeptide (TPR) repeat protein